MVAVGVMVTGVENDISEATTNSGPECLHPFRVNAQRKPTNASILYQSMS